LEDIKVKIIKTVWIQTVWKCSYSSKQTKYLWENPAIMQDVLDRLKAANNGVAEDDDMMI
jgi:hypothetical protein